MRIPSLKVVHVPLQAVLCIVPSLGLRVQLALPLGCFKLVAGVVAASPLAVLLPITLFFFVPRKEPSSGCRLEHKKLA